MTYCPQCGYAVRDGVAICPSCGTKTLYGNTPVKEETKEESSTEETETQSAEENSKYASIRRKAEEDAKRRIEEAEAKAYEKGRLEAYKGKINPYTNKPIVDSSDIEVYEMMYKLEQEGKDPINDLPNALSDRKREEQKALA